MRKIKKKKNCRENCNANSVLYFFPHENKSCSFFERLWKKYGTDRQSRDDRHNATHKRLACLITKARIHTYIHTYTHS